MPTDVPWGVVAGLAVCVAYLAVQWLIAAALLGKPSLVGEMVVLLISAPLVLTIAFTFLQACSRDGQPPHRLIGLVAPGRAGLRRAVKPVLLGALAYAGVAIIWGRLLQQLHSGPIPEQQVVRLLRQTTSPATIALAFLGGALVAPVVEEVLFRGMLYLPLRRALGVPWAAVIVGVLFALVHSYFWGLPELFVLSLIFVALFERTGTLLAPIAAHAAYNAVQIVLVLKGWS